jgi:hypothetical protein
VSLILAVSMTAAGVVYPVTDAALHHTSPIMIATLRALVGGVLLTATAGTAIVIIGVAIVNHPRAEPPGVDLTRMQPAHDEAPAPPVSPVS